MSKSLVLVLAPNLEGLSTTTASGARYDGHMTNSF